MAAAVALLALVSVVAAYVNPDSRPAIDQNLVTFVNKESGSPWKAELNQFTSYTHADARRLCGARLDDPELADAQLTLSRENKTVDAGLVSVTPIPASFDARVQWPGAIRPIRDQGACGCCWAVAAAEVLSDRFYIRSGGSIDTVLSPQDIVSCDTRGQYGCNGGFPLAAWQYMRDTGILSEECYPFTSGTHGVTGSCLLNGTQCPSKAKTTSHMYKAASAYAVGTSVAAIQNEIMLHGPIEVSFSVYMDFFSYSSGVYQYTTGALAGGHAVKMLGWGTLNGIPYWLCANSWGSSWGSNGYFLIKRGVNECGIEANPVAGLVMLF